MRVCFRETESLFVIFILSHFSSLILFHTQVFYPFLFVPSACCPSGRFHEEKKLDSQPYCSRFSCVCVCLCMRSHLHHSLKTGVLTYTLISGSTTESDWISTKPLKSKLWVDTFEKLQGCAPAWLRSNDWHKRDASQVIKLHLSLTL